MAWGGHIRLAVVTDMSDRPTPATDNNNDNRSQKQRFHENLPLTRNDSMSKTLLFCRQIIPFGMDFRGSLEVNGAGMVNTYLLTSGPTLAA
jgi:hypothetical protein